MGDVNACGNTDGDRMGDNIGLWDISSLHSSAGHWAETVSSQKASIACCASHMYFGTKELGV